MPRNQLVAALIGGEALGLGCIPAAAFAFVGVGLADDSRPWMQVLRWALLGSAGLWLAVFLLSLWLHTILSEGHGRFLFDQLYRRKVVALVCHPKIGEFLADSYAFTCLRYLRAKSLPAFNACFTKAGYPETCLVEHPFPWHDFEGVLRGMQIAVAEHPDEQQQREEFAESRKRFGGNAAVQGYADSVDHQFSKIPSYIRREIEEFRNSRADHAFPLDFHVVHACLVWRWSFRLGRVSTAELKRGFEDGDVWILYLPWELGGRNVSLYAISRREALKHISHCAACKLTSDISAWNAPQPICLRTGDLPSTLVKLFRGYLENKLAEHLNYAIRKVAEARELWIPVNSGLSLPEQDFDDFDLDAEVRRVRTECEHMIDEFTKSAGVWGPV